MAREPARLHPFFARASAASMSHSRLDNSTLVLPGPAPAVAHAHIPLQPPEILSTLRTLEQVRRYGEEHRVGACLADVMADPLGYFLFSLFLKCHDRAVGLLSFVEDVVAFRLTASAEGRAAM